MSEEKRNFDEAAGTPVYGGRFLQVWRTNRSQHEIVAKQNAVAFLVYNPDRRALAMVVQRREAVSHNVSATRNRDGLLLEVPAGHIDDFDIGCPARAMAREANEELGMLIDPDNMDFQPILNHGEHLYVSPGWTTEAMYFGYMEAGDNLFDLSRKKFGVASEGESTERIWLPIDDLAEMSFSDLKTFALVQWFLRTIYPQLPLPEKGV